VICKPCEDEDCNKCILGKYFKKHFKDEEGISYINNTCIPCASGDNNCKQCGAGYSKVPIGEGGETDDGRREEGDDEPEVVEYMCVKCKEECLTCVGECSSCPTECLPKPASNTVPPASEPEPEESKALPIWAIVVIAIVAAFILCGAIITVAICVPRCIKEKGPSIGIATSQHDVLFDDEDDVDLSPMSKKGNNKKTGDEDAFI